MHNKPQNDSECSIVQPSHDLFLEVEMWILLNQRRNNWQDTIQNGDLKDYWEFPSCILQHSVEAPKVAEEQKAA